MRSVVNVTVGRVAAAVVLMVGLIGAGTVGLAGQAGGTITAGISPSSGPPGTSITADSGSCAGNTAAVLLDPSNSPVATSSTAGTQTVVTVPFTPPGQYNVDISCDTYGGNTDIGTFPFTVTNGAGGSSASVSMSSCGVATVTTSAGLLTDLVDLPVPFGAPFSLPCGLVSFRVQGIPVGSTITLTFNWPIAATGAVKLVGTNFVLVSATSFQVTDGGAFDVDGTANGAIVDPVGPTTASAAAQFTG